jgi:hypothetical protein
MSPEQHDHFKSLVGHTLESAQYVGHGHVVGKGATGKMVPSHAHLQQGSYLPQNVANTFSDSGSADADDSTAAADYGTIDRGK